MSTTMNFAFIPANFDEGITIIEATQEEAWSVMKSKIGYIEIVNLPLSTPFFPRHQFYVDEEARMKDLPLNLRASLFSKPVTNLYGDVALLVPPVVEPETDDTPERVTYKKLNEVGVHKLLALNTVDSLDLFRIGWL